VILDSPETKVRLALTAHKETQVFKASRVCRGQLVILVYKVNKESSDRTEFKAPRVILV
jgi:hypothetical protein